MFTQNLRELLHHGLLLHETQLADGGWGWGAKFFDYDNNGRMDLMLTDMHSDMSQDIGPDQERVKSAMQWPEEHLMTGGNSIYGNIWREKMVEAAAEGGEQLLEKFVENDAILGQQAGKHLQPGHEVG